MSGISGTVSATAAVVALYVGWAAFDSEKKNNVLDYTIKKIGAFEVVYPCESDEVQNIRIFMGLINLLRPDETPDQPLPPSRCRYVSAWYPPGRPPPSSPNFSPDVPEADADGASQLRVEIADAAPEIKILTPLQHVPIPRPRPKNIPRS
jgi:hypothetical protein